MEWFSNFPRTVSAACCQFGAVAYGTLDRGGVSMIRGSVIVGGGI